jgi:hypothetical protein
MNTLHKILDVAFNKNTEENWDTVWLCCGDEGTGKSFLDLHILEWWYKRLYGKVTEDDIRHMCLTIPMFRKDLGDMKKYEMTNLDEGGALSNRRFMAKLNYEITQAYQVIRGDGLFTIITLPDPFDLDPFFTKRRVRGLIYVYKRKGNTSRFAFWSKSRFRQLVALNMQRPVKNMWLVKPTYSGGYCPQYKGVLLEPYMKLKAEKIKECRDNFLKETTESTAHLEREVIARIASKLGQKNVADALEISTKTVQRYQKAYEEQMSASGDIIPDGDDNY